MRVSNVISDLENLINANIITFYRNNCIEVTGIYRKDNNSFSKLYDEDDNTKSIDFKVKGDLSENSLVKAKCRLNVKYVGKGFYPELEALFCEIIEETSDEEKKLKDEFLKKLENFNPQTFNYIINSVTNNGNKIKLIKCLVIHGQDAQTQHDFINGVRESLTSRKNYNLKEIKNLETNLNDESLEKVIKENGLDYDIIFLVIRGGGTSEDLSKISGTAIAIKNLETNLNDGSLEKVIRQKGPNYDIIFLVRGGGQPEDLSKIGGIKSAIAVLDVGKPFFIAIGHSQDRNISLLEKVCDYAYHTPSALGTQFGEALKIEIEKEEIKQALKEKEEEIKQALKEKEEEIKQALKEKEEEIKQALKALNKKEEEIKQALKALNKKEEEKEALRQELLKELKEKEELKQKLGSLVKNLENENEISKNKSNKLYVYMIAGIVVGIVVGIALASIVLKS
jgi:hypothetical protein